MSTYIQPRTMKSSALIARHRMCGVSLIEVLVTVVVLSIGLLGLAGLQASGTKFNHSAYMRSQAVALAYDIADRLRANPLSALNYVQPSIAGYSSALGPGCEEDLNPLTPANEINQWKHCLQERLPLGNGRVCVLPRIGPPASTVHALDRCPLNIAAAFVDACGVAHLRPQNQDVYLIQVFWDNSRIQNENAMECVVARTEVSPL